MNSVLYFVLPPRIFPPRTEFTTNPPLAGAYTPKKGDICAAKFVDDQWYRARVEKMSTVSAMSLS